MSRSKRVERDAMLGRRLWRIVPFVKPYKWRIAGGILTNGAARAFDFLPLIVIGAVVDAVAAGAEPRVFMWYGVAIFGTFVGLATFQSISDYLWDTVAQKSRHDIRTRLYDHIQTLTVEDLEKRHTGDLMAVVGQDVDNLENFIADSTTSIVRLLVTFLGTYVILLFMDWRLALLLFAPLPFAVFAVRFFATRVQPRYRETRKAVAGMNNILAENIQGLPVIQAYTARETQAERINRQSADYRDAAIGAAQERARFVPMLYLLAGLAFGGVIGYGGYLTVTGAGPTIGEYTTFVLLATRLIMPLFILGMLLNQIQRSEASAERVMDVLEMQPSIEDAPGARDLPRAPSSISFENVTFAYDGRMPVLNGVSFKAKRGQVIGVVGHTGAGKSTILKLLLRYYKPLGGRVKVNGHDLADLRLDSVRRHVGYVSQEAFLFTGTIRANITLGRPEATDEEVLEAARIAGATEFIADLPEGLDTLVGERGLKLSGGQRQRISLARAILRDPAILILDEATSAVDTRTERLIQENLHDRREGRITIAVAHRLSTIRQADNILVLVDGCVVEEGSHDALVSRGGVYADLWKVQSGSGASYRVAASAPP